MGRGLRFIRARRGILPEPYNRRAPGGRLVPRTARTVTSVVFLLVLSAVVALAARRGAFEGVAWPDECIYLAGARNAVDRGTLDTNFYLTYSLLRRGYPHRDVHMPGYVLILAPFVKAWGATFEAGTAPNLILFPACALLVYALGLRLLEDHRQALTSAALFTLLPPFPGYLYVIYPEILVAFALLLSLTVGVHARGRLGAVMAGILYAIGALFRETLLLSLPLFAARLPRRDLTHGFLPAAAATLLLVVMPLSRDRAVHSNALYPSVVEEALRTDAPASALVRAVLGNVATNLRMAASANPLASAEDAVLALMAALVVAAVFARRRLPPAARPLALATFVSLLALSVAVLALYVVRERGGVWGGVRACMPWAPVLLILSTPLLFAVRRRGGPMALALVVALGFAALDRWQVYFFYRYKHADHEDQDRNATYIARYIDAYQPRRIVSRSFLYGLTHYPVEVVWSLPRDGPELLALNQAIGYEFLVIHERNPLRFVLMGNPRFLRVNKEDRGAEFLVWRRLY